MDRSTLASLLGTAGFTVAVATRLAVRWANLDRAIGRPVVVVAIGVLGVGAVLYVWSRRQEQTTRRV